MKVKFFKLWDSLHSSYWFVPALMAALAITLAFAMLALDRTGKSGPVENLNWVYTGGPEGARTLLSAVAGSMITVAGTVFSITLVALQLASSQFGPRLLRNFMQDTGNQIVLGTFIATFIYCLLVLRSIRGEDYNVFVPQISVTVGIILVLTSIGVLIYFIHHASTSIQAENVIAEVGEELEKTIERLFPEKIGLGEENSKGFLKELPANFEQESYIITSLKSGYLQAIDGEMLIKIAQKKDLLLRVLYRPGKFVVQKSNLVMVWPKERVNRHLIKQIRETFILGRQRTQHQDVEFPVNQLVEIAVRALSPGINDPFTAIRCIDQLSAGLSHLAVKEFPSAYRYDKNNILRVIVEPVTFRGIIDAAFNQIRQYGSTSVAVMIRLLEAIATIAERTDSQKDSSCLLHHAHAIERASRQISEQLDRQDIEERYQAALRAIEHH